MLTDFWSFHHNQSGLAFVKDFSAGFYHQSGFISEMDYQAIGLLVPVSSGALAGSFSYYGYEHYHQTKAGIAYGRYLAKNLAAGIQIDYFHTRIAGIYGSDHLLTFEAGLHLRINERCVAGAHVFNPVRQGMGQYDEKISVVIRLGAGYDFSDRLLLCIEAEKDMEKPLVPKLALEYELVPFFHLRTGISLNPVQNAFGMGYTWNDLQADVAFLFHPLLGNIPNFSLTYAF